MEKKSNYASEGVSGRRGHAKPGTNSSILEAREFLSNMGGKHPQEVRGAVASSSLGLGVLQATLGTIVLMGALTIGPYALAKFMPPPAEKAVAAEKEPAKP